MLDIANSMLDGSFYILGRGNETSSRESFNNDEDRDHDGEGWGDN